MYDYYSVTLSGGAWLDSECVDQLYSLRHIGGGGGGQMNVYRNREPASGALFYKCREMPLEHVKYIHKLKSS